MTIREFANLCELGATIEVLTVNAHGVVVGLESMTAAGIRSSYTPDREIKGIRKAHGRALAVLAVKEDEHGKG